MSLHHTTVAFLCFACFALGALLFGGRGCGVDNGDYAALVAERDAALAHADRYEAQAAANADTAFVYRRIADGLAPVVHDLLASRDEARTEGERARAERDRVARALTTARDEAAPLRDASDAAPDDAHAAREALAACYDTLSACERLTVSQDSIITRQDSVIVRGDRAIVALQHQAAALDSTAGYYQSAYAGLLTGYAEQGRALNLYAAQTDILSRRVTIRTRQRDAALVGLGIATLAALLNR